MVIKLTWITVVILLDMLCLGMGKSRIIAAVVVLKQLYAKTGKFTIVFTTDLLKGVDEKVYLRLKDLLGVQVNLIVYNDK